MDEETDRALKGVTPFKNGFYRPEESTIEEIEKQRNILYQTAQRKRLIFVEVDEFQRLRYISTIFTNYFNFFY